MVTLRDLDWQAVAPPIWQVQWVLQAQGWESKLLAAYWQILKALWCYPCLSGFWLGI